MNDLQIKKKIKAAAPGKYSVGDGLYLRISDQGTAFWSVRYSINGRRREIIIGRYGRRDSGGLPLADAKLKSAQTKASVREGNDPLTERKRGNLARIQTVAQVADDWLNIYSKQLKNPQIPKRIFSKDIAPSIGELPVSKVVPLDILSVLRAINESGRPTIANDALALCKQVFNHAVKLGLLTSNPALVFTNRDAGGMEQSRHRALCLGELQTVFRVFRENSIQFTRENYLAFALLVVLGVRKGELIAAKWHEFDFEKLEWTLDGSRTKTGAGIVIPIPEQTTNWFEELRVHSCGSEYLFPSRKQNALKPHMSPDTLNHALSKMFGEKVDSKKNPTRNKLGDAGVRHFIIHDLRRTCRSLLAANGVAPHVAERCLNHKLRGVEAIYDRYDYLDERRAALSQLAGQIKPFVDQR